MNQDDYSERSQIIDKKEDASQSDAQNHSGHSKGVILTLLVLFVLSIIIVVYKPFRSPENSQSTVSTQEPAIATGQSRSSSNNSVDSDYGMSSNERTYLMGMYNQLIVFKDSESFRIYGLAQGGPHYTWASELDDWRRGDVSMDAEVTAGEIRLLAHEYVFNGAD